MFSNDELAAARKLTEPLLDVWSYRRDAVALAAAVLREAERERQPLGYDEAGHCNRIRIGDAVCGPIDIVPDEQGGHLEFNGKIWRAEKLCVLCGKPAEKTCMDAR